MPPPTRVTHCPGPRATLLLTLVGMAVLALNAAAGPVAVAQDLAYRVHLPLLLLAAMPDPPTSPATPSRPPLPSPPATPIAAEFAPFGLVTLEPELRLSGSGITVDSLAFWEAPVAEDTLLLVTAKGNQRVEVWRWPFQGAEQPALQHPSFVAGSQVNGIVVDQDQGRVYVSVSRPSSTVAVFALPGLAPLGTLVDGQVDLRIEPNLGLLTLPDGSKRLYVSADDRVYAFDPAVGAAKGGFRTEHAMETVLADDVDQVLYIPDETSRRGVFAYHPDGTPYERGGVASFGGGGIFEADAEGIALHPCLGPDGRDDGRGLLIVSDQKNDATDFEIFDRRSWAHLGRLQLNGVRRTDGIASTERPLPGHPAGFFAAANDDIEVALVGWDRIQEATGLRCAGGIPAEASPTAAQGRQSMARRIEARRRPPGGKAAPGSAVGMSLRDDVPGATPKQFLH